MSEKLYNNNNNNVSLNEPEAEKRKTEIKTIVNAGLSKCALSEPIMGPAAGDSIKKAKWKIFQSKKAVIPLDNCLILLLWGIVL